MLRNTLLVCGILSSLLFIVMNVLLPMEWDAYSSASQTVSELSAIDAPTRAQWLKLGMVYTLLVITFGIGVAASAHQNHPLRVTGFLIIAYGVVGFAWPYAPMHLRGAGFSFTDIMHLNLAVISFMLMLLSMGFGAAALGIWFRVYSILSLIILFVAGVLTSLNVPQIFADLPTPRVGIWERMGIGVFLVWIIVLALTLLYRRPVNKPEIGDGPRL